ncbi:hypothetical protein FS749_009098 [Ceratobasidium sp. UAMH 11750]|nr:hypothetical protein FS749_009098 [Ceratobasidium sp. UAMH 11750]
MSEQEPEYYITNQRLDGSNAGSRENNQTDPQALADVPHTLTNPEQEGLLRKNKALFGFLMDDHSGPTRPTQQVATYKITGQYYSPAWMQEENSIDTDIIHTDCERDSNYVHQGWSLSAISKVSPWTLSRMHQNGRLKREGSWTTQRKAILRLSVNIPATDLQPSPGFEADVRAALAQATKAEKCQALYKALNHWGDVIALTYDFGTSLTITDLDQNIVQENLCLDQSFTVSRNARLNTKGGTANCMEQILGTWLSQDLPCHNWRIIRVARVMPTLELLDKTLQLELQALYSSLVSYFPPVLEGITGRYLSWDESSHALKPISSIAIGFSNRMDSLFVNYTDKSQSKHHGGNGQGQHTFDLNNGECISDIIVWNNIETVSAIQFVTTFGRISPHYGGNDGIPNLMNSEGGVLAGFSGRRTELDEKDVIGRIQTIWRHDIPQPSCNSVDARIQLLYRALTLDLGMILTGFR